MDSKERTARTRLPGLDNQDRTARTGQLEQDNHGGIDNWDSYMSVFFSLKPEIKVSLNGFFW
jgi:hypothetical protein